MRGLVGWSVVAVRHRLAHRTVLQGRRPSVSSGLARMSYALDPSSPVHVSVQHEFRQQITHAIDALSDKDGDAADEAVHEARKSVKKLRALLRLVRPELGAHTYDDFNRSLRDAARLLSQVRDAAAVLESFDKLVEEKELDSARFTAVRARLAERRESGHGVSSRRDVMTRAEADLQQLLANVERWELPDEGWQLVSAGFRDIYQRGGRALKRAAAHPSAEHFHEWRKQVKYHWYHLRFLAPLWPGLIKAHAEELEQLSDWLGDEHDLSVLKGHVLAWEQADDLPIAELQRAMDERTEELRVRALALGSRVYGERPKRLERRFRSYFRAWDIENTPRRAAE